jgi:hypothetical protein
MVYLNMIRSETKLIMKPQSTKKKVGAKRRRRPLPEEYICIAPAEAPLVFDWLNGAGFEADKEFAEIHLKLCFHCQEAVARWMMLDEKFRVNAKRCLHLSTRPSELPRTADSDESSMDPSGQSADDEPLVWSMRVVGRG